MHGYFLELHPAPHSRIDNDCNKMSSGFRLKLISLVGILTEEHLIERKFTFSDPSLVGTSRYNLFYKGTTFENSFGKYSL